MDKLTTFANGCNKWLVAEEPKTPRLWSLKKPSLTSTRLRSLQKPSLARSAL